MSDNRDTLYVVSCRKPDPGSRKDSDVRLHAPKRAGTFTLTRVTGGIESEDPASTEMDTDAGENPGRSSAAGQRRSWAEQQRATEDRIAAHLWSLGPLVLYVHGYNTKPNEAVQAALRVQQGLDDAHVGTTVVLFTWPSAGHLLDYFPDQKAAGRFGSFALVNLLMSMGRNRGADPLHGVAHSMGTYVLTRALSTIATLHLELALPQQQKIMSQVAFMQPDIDYDILCSGYTGPSYDSPSYLEIPDGYAATEMVERLTIYCSTNDVALFASLFKNRSKRLGAYGPGLEGEHDLARLMTTRVRSNVEVVNCDEWELLDPAPAHSHSHFLECPHIMADVARVVTGQGSQANVDLTQVVPRWYRLAYRPAPGASAAGILRRMAAFWGTVGGLGVNPIIVFLVKAKKLVQQLLQFTGWFLPLGGLTLSIFGVTATRIPGNPFLRPLLWIAIGGAIIYLLAWLRGRSIQKEEDAPPPSVHA